MDDRGDYNISLQSMQSSQNGQNWEAEWSSPFLKEGTGSSLSFSLDRYDRPGQLTGAKMKVCKKKATII